MSHEVLNPSQYYKHCVFLSNKPQGVTSNRVLQKVKRAFGQKKAGHTGSLDPLATGVLPLCFGEATKFSQFGLEAVKSYRVTARFGVETNTGDSDGEVIKQTPKPENLTEEILRNVILSFKGVQKQTPSLYSALKYQGRPLYEYARQGISVPIPARDICISEIEIEAINLEEGWARLWVQASKGTYIRSLVQDIGSNAGWGAHVTQLHRTHAGLFHESACHSFNIDDTASLVGQMPLPVSILLLGLPWKIVLGSEALKLDNGHAVSTEWVQDISSSKKSVLQYYEEMDLQFNMDAPNKVMQDFYDDHLQSDDKYINKQLVAIFTLKPGKDLSSIDSNAEALLDLSKILSLKGIAQQHDATLQPKRMVTSGLEIF